MVLDFVASKKSFHVAIVCITILVTSLFVAFIVRICTHYEGFYSSYVQNNSSPMPISAQGTIITPIYNSPPNTVYIFWTGGFDSTFRVLQAVLDERKIVQPFYLSGNIDNSPTKHVKRKNQQMEFQAMKRVRSELCNSYPDVCTRLRPPVIVNYVPLSEQTNRWMKKLAADRIVRRPICQYGSLSEFANYVGVPIELGIVRDGHSNAGIYAGLQNNVECEGIQCRVTDAAIRNRPEFAIFKSLRFPLMSLDKSDMWAIATQNGYDHLLRYTWSCWYPTAEGKPCNKCIMCRERILKTI